MQVSLHGETFDPADPGQVAEARLIQSALMKRGFLHRKVEVVPPPNTQVIGRGIRATHP